MKCIGFTVVYAEGTVCQYRQYFWPTAAHVKQLHFFKMEYNQNFMCFFSSLPYNTAMATSNST